MIPLLKYCRGRIAQLSTLVIAILSFRHERGRTLDGSLVRQLHRTLRTVTIALGSRASPMASAGRGGLGAQLYYHIYGSLPWQ